MLNPDYVGEQLQKHFSNLTDQQFLEEIKIYCPEISTQKIPAQREEQEENRQSLLLQPYSFPLPLKAELVCAPNTLISEQRQTMLALAGTVSALCTEQKITLYPLSQQNHLLITDIEDFKTDRERVSGCDLLIYLSHDSGLDSEETLDFATAALLPVIQISQGEKQEIRMATGTPSVKVSLTWKEHAEVETTLREALRQIRPVLEQRKLAFSKYDVNIVGERIRHLREEAGLTRAELVHHTPHITLETLRDFEELTDRCANPSLVQLREIAAILKTTVADLVEPNLNGRLMAAL